MPKIAKRRTNNQGYQFKVFANLIFTRYCFFKIGNLQAMNFAFDKRLIPNNPVWPSDLRLKKSIKFAFGEILFFIFRPNP